MKIKKGDQVKIISGKDRGKSGKVIGVFSKDSRISVEGINLYKKRVRPTKQGQKGETVIVPRPLSASNVMIICSNCKKAARVGFRVEEKEKVRLCKKCGARV